MKKILATMLSLGVCTSAFASSEGFDEYLNKLRAEARDKGISEQVVVPRLPMLNTNHAR